MNYKPPVDYQMSYAVARVWDVLDAIAETHKWFSADVVVLLPSDGQVRKLSCSLAELGIKSVLHLQDVEFGELGNPNRMCISGIFACSKFTARSFQNKFNLRSEVSHNIFQRDRYECAGTGEKSYFCQSGSCEGSGYRNRISSP